MEPSAKLNLILLLPVNDKPAGDSATQQNMLPSQGLTCL